MSAPRVVIVIALEETPTLTVSAQGDDLDRLLAWFESPRVASQLRSLARTLALFGGAVIHIEE